MSMSDPVPMLDIDGGFIGYSPLGSGLRGPPRLFLEFATIRDPFPEFVMIRMFVRHDVSDFSV